MAVQIEETLPTAAQWMSLRKSVGWATFPEETAQKSLEVTPYCICAMEDGELIGMGRVLGDGVISFYIGNIMVRPDRQGEGIGREIMERIIAYVEAHAAPGAIASLMSIQGKEDFYERFGFRRRPDENRGAGMSRSF